MIDNHAKRILQGSSLDFLTSTMIPSRLMIVYHALPKWPARFCKPSVRSSSFIPHVRSSWALIDFHPLVSTPDLSASDVLNCSPAFWNLHLDAILSLDLACFTTIAAHLNLTVGTLARHLKARPDLQPLVDSMLRLNMVGVYLFSERGHGLDVFNLETTATKTKDGFILHTPREEAAK